MKFLRTRHLKHFAKLPPDQRSAFIAALFLIPAFAMALRTVGFGRCFAWVERTHVSLLSNDERTAPHHARLVAWAARYGVCRGNCLSQSLTLCRLLRRRGIEAQLKIGVRRAGTTLEAHAWVQLADTPLNDTPDVPQRFAPFPALDKLPSAPFV
jgi:hypothetical protein